MTPKKERILNYTKSRLSRFTSRANYEQLREFTQEALTHAKIKGSNENLSDIEFQAVFDKAYPGQESDADDTPHANFVPQSHAQSTQPFPSAANDPKKVGETTPNCGDRE